MEFLTIGQMAEMNNVSIKALRLYQERGLLAPEYVDNQSGRRYYDISQSGRLDLIVHLQQIGFSLDDIREIIDAGDMETLRSRVADRQKRLQEEQQRLLLAQKAAQALTESCDAYLDRPALGYIFLERLPQRKVLTFHMPTPPSDARFEVGTSSYFEWLFRQVKSQVVNRELPLTLFHDICSFYSEDVLSGQSKLVNKCFVFIPESLRLDSQAGYEILPEGMYLTVYLDRAYDPGDIKLAVSYEWIAKIMQYANELDLEVRAEGFGEQLCRYPRMLAGKADDMLFRICIPVCAKG